MSKIQESKPRPKSLMRTQMENIEKKRDNPKGYTDPPRKGIYLDGPSDRAIEHVLKGKTVVVT